MRDEREQKSEIDKLQERMKRVGRGAHSPKPASDKATELAGTNNTIRLDHSRLLKIETDNSIIEQVTLADVITARTHSNEREECLFKRPKGETKARGGQTYSIHTLQFSVQNVKDLRYLTEAIGRMKQNE
jgi:hypothetical protein